MQIIDYINNNKVDMSVIKGNTFRVQVKITNDARLSYIPCAGDVIMFSVFNKYTDVSPIYEKKIPYDTLLLDLNANETAKLRINDYVYRIRLIRQNGDVDDFLHGKFNVKEMID